MQHVTVVGSGTMGNGIAHVFAQHGYPTTLIDQSSDALNKALKTIQHNLDRMVAKEKLTSDQAQRVLSNISTTTSLQEGLTNSDIVIEAIYESEEAKTDLFKAIGQWTHPSTIVASNTSSISINKLAERYPYPGQVIGMHFMNPVPIMTLVEVIKGKSTTASVVQAVMTITESLGKTPILAANFPGFVANRILMPMINEAILALEQGVSSVEGIDQIMMLGMAHPMGPLHLADYIGLDVCLNIMNVMYSELKEAKYQPAKTLEQLVKASELGVKSGLGFYDYSQGLKNKVVASRFAHIQP